MPNVCRVHSDLMLSARADPKAAERQRRAALLPVLALVPRPARAVAGDGGTTEPGAEQGIPSGKL